jgi:archaemetzincin
MSPEQIGVLPVGDVPGEDLDALASGLKRILNKEIVLLKPVPLPSAGKRKGKDETKTRPVEGTGEIQYYAGPFLKLTHELAHGAGKKYLKVLAVTDVDLYTDGLNFIFGQAEISGRAALISTVRLKYQVFWSSGRRRLHDRELFIDRMLKEAVHELGHTFGLRHCKTRTCVMTFSNCLEDTDLKSSDYCTDCRQKLFQ